MREVLSIHVGQAGIQTSEACWELLCAEHNVDLSGHLIQKDLEKPWKNEKKGQENECDQREKREDGLNTFFLAQKGLFIPRAILVDLEGGPIDQLKKGKVGTIMPRRNMVCGKEDAANNFGRGRYCDGRRIIDQVQEKIRDAVESCENLQGFLFFHSASGGTGTGLNSLILEHISSSYSKKPKISFPIFPSPNISSSVVEPYNSVFSTHYLLEHIDVALMFDNEALSDVCHNLLSVQTPSFPCLNRLIAQVMSSLTTSLRFPGTLNVTLNEIQVNLVPFPRLKFLTAALAPILPHEIAYHERNSVSDITPSLFEPTNHFVKINLTRGKYMGVTLMYRGDVCPSEVQKAMHSIRTNRVTRFVDWCPTGFKSGINSQPPDSVPLADLAPTPRSAFLMANTTAMEQVFERTGHKFDLMFAKRAFVHWFVGTGLEEGEFNEARENMLDLQREYFEAGVDTPLLLPDNLDEF